jgi:hypothetical protein
MMGFDASSIIRRQKDRERNGARQTLPKKKKKGINFKNKQKRYGHILSMVKESLAKDLFHQVRQRIRSIMWKCDLVWLE